VHAHARPCLVSHTLPCASVLYLAPLPPCSPSADDVKKILKSVGANADDTCLNKVNVYRVARTNLYPKRI